jgi:hypothetical protein
MKPTFHFERLFRETEGVHFSDIWVPGQNGLDLVHHQGQAISPPSTGGVKHFYVHKHQTDNNRVIHGQRVFELFWTGFMHPRWFVMLRPESGALRIPPGCFHRSVSCSEGSILLNHAQRDPDYDESTEFRPTIVRFLETYTPKFMGASKEEILYFLQSNGDQLPKELA